MLREEMTVEEWKKRGGQVADVILLNRWQWWVVVKVDEQGIEIQRAKEYRRMQNCDNLGVEFRFVYEELSYENFNRKYPANRWECLFETPSNGDQSLRIDVEFRAYRLGATTLVLRRRGKYVLNYVALKKRIAD